MQDAILSYLIVAYMKYFVVRRQLSNEFNAHVNVAGFFKWPVLLNRYLWIPFQLIKAMRLKGCQRAARLTGFEMRRLQGEGPLLVFCRTLLTL
ncbi:hypothetical protein CCL08_23285 [Pseudomonas congelans]|nr:hypothetical protein CCL08_23285 [Pseudomonas congelans]